MARTLADLTLKLSQDLSDLEARCTKKMDEVEEERDSALMEIADARKALENMGEVLAAAGATFDHVVKTTVFLQDIQDFKAMNRVYGEFFPAAPPARSAAQVTDCCSAIPTRTSSPSALPKPVSTRPNSSAAMTACSRRWCRTRLASTL